METVSSNGHKRAVLYARVSTTDQKDEGYSLPSQIDAMRKYAEREGFEIAGEFQDDYSGATPIEYRPQGAKAYAMLKDGGADAMIAYTFDRFARPAQDGDEWQLPILIQGLAKSGKEIHTCDRGHLKTDLISLMMTVLEGNRAGEERRKIRERTMRGKRTKASEGKVIGGPAPYGYRHARDANGRIITFEIVEEEARIVRLIYRWYVRGDEHATVLSTKAIARRLTEMHAPTPNGSRRKIAGVWDTSQILEMIKNEVYAGVWWYGARMGQGRKTRPREEQIAVNVPAIIDRELWNRAQLQRKKNTSFSLRNTKNEYLLRGLIKCGCGYAMCGHSVEGILYYRCNWKEKWAAEAENRPCPSRHIRANAIEADIWDEIKELFRDPDKFWEQLKAAQQSADEKLEPLRDKLQVTDDFIKRFKEKAKRITEELTDTKKGEESYESLKQSQRDVDARLKELNIQREKIVKELETGRITDKRIETIMDFVRKVKRGIVKAENNFQAKRKLFEDLGVDVTVTSGKYHLKTILGETDGEISLIGRDGVRIVPKSSKPCRAASVCSWSTSMRAGKNLNDGLRHSR